MSVCPSACIDCKSDNWPSRWNPSHSPTGQWWHYNVLGRVTHLWNFCTLTTCSEDNRCQKCLTSDWHGSHHCRSEMEGNEMAGSGRTSSGLPIKKCLGVSASTPLSSHGKATSGLLLRQASILLKQLWALRRRVYCCPLCVKDVSSCFSLWLTTGHQNVVPVLVWNPMWCSEMNRNLRWLPCSLLLTEKLKTFCEVTCMWHQWIYFRDHSKSM